VRRNKFGAKKTVVDGITFDSQAEANRYSQLKLLQRAGEIRNLELQPSFEIIPSYQHPVTGEKIRAAYYKADFRITWKDGKVTVEDVKGMKTPIYKLKKKLIEAKYGILIEEVS
jgi:hypothetical protein